MTKNAGPQQSGGIRWLVRFGLLAWMLGLALGSRPAAANPASDPASAKVRVQIVAIEAERGRVAMDKALKQSKVAAQLEAMGYTAAKVADTLDADVSVKGRVVLHLFEKTPKERALTVALEEVTPSGTVRLAIDLDKPAVKLKTEHKKGGTALVAQPTSKQTALFLAVTPSLR